jgi:hypothetical protein
LINQTLVLSARGSAIWEIYNIEIPSAFLPSKSDLRAYFSFYLWLVVLHKLISFGNMCMEK